jgi:hypothetical protein
MGKRTERFREEIDNAEQKIESHPVIDSSVEEHVLHDAPCEGLIVGRDHDRDDIGGPGSLRDGAG